MLALYGVALMMQLGGAGFVIHDVWRMPGIHTQGRREQLLGVRPDLEKPGEMIAGEVRAPAIVA